MEKVPAEIVVCKDPSLLSPSAFTPLKSFSLKHLCASVKLMKFMRSFPPGSFQVL